MPVHHKAEQWVLDNTKKGKTVRVKEIPRTKSGKVGTEGGGALEEVWGFEELIIRISVAAETICSRPGIFQNGKAAVAQWSRHRIMAGMSFRAQYHKRPAL
ncbi:hypothetical protein TNCV_4575801 [Trichonephila clavipes]|nr:hypothetical protein TNCV_4575801 [Trichonephila clavipes]